MTDFRTKQKEATGFEWWTNDPWAKIYQESPGICFWLADCAFNTATKRFHIPCRKNGAIYTFLHNHLRNREAQIAFLLNGVFRERRGGFYDTAWMDGKHDFWLVCDGYLEPSNTKPTPSFSRAANPEDNKVLSWVWKDFKGGRGGYNLAPFIGYKDAKGPLSHPVQQQLGPSVSHAQGIPMIEAQEAESFGYL